MKSIKYIAEKTGISQKRIRDIIDGAPYLYRDVKILQKDKLRDISIPHLELKILQQKILNNILYKEIHFPNCLHGGVEGKSIYTNAFPHTGKKIVMCLDIKNFFPSIHFRKLNEILSTYFNIKLASILTRLTTHDYCLPQGAPTSPFLSNLSFLKQDLDISSLCKLNNLSYTRFFDDITISGKNVDRLYNRIESIINQGGFRINRRKTKIQTHKNSQLVTGVVVNIKNSPRIPRLNFDRVSQKISSINTLGLGYFKNKNIFYKEIQIINGEISFIQQIEPTKGKKLKKDFDSALEKLRI